jgi:nucleotide-binding universal stress UspA family protein
MQQFKNILLILNADDQETAAFDKAVSLAKQNGARLTLFSVLKEPPGYQGYSVSVTQYQLKSAVTERREWLRGLTLGLPKDEIEVVISVVQGASFLEIIRQVLREQHDLVIITAEQKNGLRSRLFGTTSMHLMRKCPCPVWVVKRAQTQPFSRILAAVDPSVHDSEQDSLNPLILQLAANLARKETAELHIVHVWYLFGERYGHSRGLSEDAQEAREQAKAQHKQSFDALLSQTDITDVKPQLHLLEGDPDERIPELAVQQDIDLLVMGTVCRTGIAGFLIGSTAEEVLNQVDCSVLTLKPEGFVTPVTLE